MFTEIGIQEPGSKIFSPFSIYHAGEEDCAPNHSFGPAIRDHYLMHFVLSGKGYFESNGRRYELRQGQGFLIAPNQVTFYQADGVTPWHYCWIGFQGHEAKNMVNRCRISTENPIFNVSDWQIVLSCVRTIQQILFTDETSFETLSAFFQLLSTVKGKEERTVFHKKTPYLVKDYIKKNYSYPITVHQIAENLSVNRSHLFRVFKEQYGISIQQYLLEYRLEQAVRLMELEHMDITEIMYSCGFHDLPNFSRQFKRKYGVSPSSYCKNLAQLQKESLHTMR